MAGKTAGKSQGYSSRIPEQLVHIARIALSGNPRDLALYLKRLARRLSSEFPEQAQELEHLLTQSALRYTPLRQASTETLPVDAESRLHLARLEHPVHRSAGRRQDACSKIASIPLTVPTRPAGSLYSYE